MSGFYAADGSMNVTVVTSSATGCLYAPDGSINVVNSSGNANGAYHPSGAWWVTYTTTPVNSIRAPDGSLYVTTTNQSGAARVTVVSGTFTPGGGTYIQRWPFFFV